MANNLTINEVTRNGKPHVWVSDGSADVFFPEYKKGVSYVGSQMVIDAVNKNQDALQGLGLTSGVLNMLMAVSENEGNLDAINTWDDSYLSFGMFQWTLGVKNDPGELPALVDKIKKHDFNIFQTYYGQYGLDTQLSNSTSGFFTLKGVRLDSAAQKENLRSNEWAYYFWKSGQDPVVQVVEVQHAISRLDIFYKSDAYKVNGYYIADLVTSQYGVALILDNHVNRPGYIAGCLGKALTNTGLTNPTEWGAREEMKLIDEYINVRATYGKNPMTYANKRAEVTKKYLDKGFISADRGTFKW